MKTIVSPQDSSSTELAPLWSELFVDHLASQPVNHVIIHLDGWRTKPMEMLLQTSDEQSGDIVVVILNSGGEGFLGRLLALALRRRVIYNVKSFFRAIDVEPLGSFAIYPSLDVVRVVFELESAAERYAESNLVPVTIGLGRSFIHAFMKKLFGCFPQIEVVAVVGRKR